MSFIPQSHLAVCFTKQLVLLGTSTLIMRAEETYFSTLVSANLILEMVHAYLVLYRVPCVYSMKIRYVFIEFIFS